MSFTPDLFATADADASGVHAFEVAFRSWQATAVAADRLQRESTLEFYEAMWSPFQAWCLAQSPPVTLDNLSEEDLEQFLAHREEVNGSALSPRYAWRLLTLVDRVLAHDALEQGGEKNPAAMLAIKHTDDIRRANLGERPGMDFLDPDQAGRLVAFLGSVRPGAGGRRQLSGWQELRNLTTVALHLGAGITPGELRELSLDAPVTAGGRWKGVPWKLGVPGNGNRPARETLVAPWAGQLLKQWLAVRAELGAAFQRDFVVNGKPRLPYLMPSRTGRQWGKMAHYEAVAEVMVAAGVDEPGSSSGGAFRLRHTFALRQLRRRRSAEDVARWMGIANVHEIERYTAVLYSYDEAV